MRTLIKFFTISAIACLFMLVAPHISRAQGYVSDQEFYDNLQNYGTWVQDDRYGNVWVPDVDDDFRPYATNGYWVQTEYGTTWVSDYPWGWATFHYGRWRYDDYYGWEWIPGHQWAPAWVSWRHGGGYYGWAPLQPGISISISFGGGYHVPDNYWVCAPQAYINSRYINRYYAPPTRSVTIIRNTTYIHNTYVNNNNTYITGPRPSEIQRVTHRSVPVYAINNASSPGAAKVENRSINIYRPVVHAAPDARPVRVVNAAAYKQQHPNEAIGRPGAPVNAHTNAARLATVARSSHPNTGVVHVNPAPKVNHAALPNGHENIGPVTPQKQAPANTGARQHNVTPAVMPPADHHDPTVRQPAAGNQQKQQPQQQATQQKAQATQQAQQRAQQQATQQRSQAQQAQQRAQQQAAQATQQAQQRAQQQAAQQRSQATQQAQQRSQAQQEQQRAQQQAAQQRSQAQQAQQRAQQQGARQAAAKAAAQKHQQEQQKQTPPAN